MLVAVEAYILRGGKYEDLEKIVTEKLKKWEALWFDHNHANIERIS